MILLLDLGNTSSKIAVMNDGGEIVHFERLGESWSDAYSRLERKFGPFLKILVSNVAGPQPELESVLESTGVAVHNLTWDGPEGQRFLKNIPEGLGADRLAAVIAARVLAPNDDIVVSDAGTCLTFDVVTADGQYVGGNISPGVALRLRCMHEHTAALPLFYPEGEAPEMGYDLPTAMRGGAVNGVKWEIEGFVRALRKKYPKVRHFFTGGNSFEFEEDVKDITVCDSALVLKGLYEAFKENNDTKQ